MAKTAHQQKLERLQDLKDLLRLELALAKPSLRYIEDLQDSIADLERHLSYTKDYELYKRL